MNLDGFRLMLEVNVLGVARTIEAVLPGMIARGRGHIVGISSVAGYRGLPWMPGYSASKAALTTYLEALRPALKIRGVKVTTLHPGFVRTGMTVEAPFRRPVPMLEPEEAAGYVVRAVERRPRDSTFPLSAALGMGLLRRLPNRAFDYCMDKAGPEGPSRPSFEEAIMSAPAANLRPIDDPPRPPPRAWRAAWTAAGGSKGATSAPGVSARIPLRATSFRRSAR